MNIATIEIQPRLENVTFTDDMMSVGLEDGRTITVPLNWYPRLSQATAVERNNWRVFEDSDRRDVIFWESLDELIPVIALLNGAPSRESERSLERWLAQRKTDNSISGLN
jgi:hypothetical protein